MENRNSLFTQDEHRTFFRTEQELVYEAKHTGKTPNALFDFWREKKKLFEHRVSERYYRISY